MLPLFGGKWLQRRDGLRVLGPVLVGEPCDRIAGVLAFSAYMISCSAGSANTTDARSGARRAHPTRSGPSSPVAGGTWRVHSSQPCATVLGGAATSRQARGECSDATADVRAPCSRAG